MSKISKKILTVILVLSMLFGVFATTIAAASSEPKSGLTTSAKNPDGREESAAPSDEGSADGGASGSFTNGWCDIIYDGGDITVVLTPDKEAVLGMTKEDVKSLLSFILDAMKKIIFDEVILDVLPGAELKGGSIVIDTEGDRKSVV